MKGKKAGKERLRKRDMAAAAGRTFAYIHYVHLAATLVFNAQQRTQQRGTCDGIKQ